MKFKPLLISLTLSLGLTMALLLALSIVEGWLLGGTLASEPLIALA